MSNVLIEEKTMTDIANAIREKSGTVEKMKPAEMPQAINKIPCENIEPYLLCRAIDYSGLTMNIETLKVKIPYLQDSLANFLNTTKGMQTVEIDCNRNKIKSLYWFNRYVLSTTPTIQKIIIKNADLSQCENYNQAFYYGRNNSLLKEIDADLDFSSAKTTKSVDGALAMLSKLEKIRFVPNTLFVNLSLYYSSLLTAESIQSIINGLADLTGQTAQTITFHLDVKNKLTEEQIASATSKNWNIA